MRRGDQLLDLWRRSRDLDRSLGLYRDVCDLSCSNLDCHSLDRDRQSSRGRSCLLEYIGGSPERSRQRSTRINGRAGAICAWEKTRPASPGPEGPIARQRQASNRTLPRRRSTSLLSDTRAQNRARTHVPLLAQLLRRRERSPLAGVTVVHPERSNLGIVRLPTPRTTRRAHRLTERSH